MCVCVCVCVCVECLWMGVKWRSKLFGCDPASPGPSSLTLSALPKAAVRWRRRRFTPSSRCLCSLQRTWVSLAAVFGSCFLTSCTSQVQGHGWTTLAGILVTLSHAWMDEQTGRKKNSIFMNSLSVSTSPHLCFTLTHTHTHALCQCLYLCLTPSVSVCLSVCLSVCVCLSLSVSVSVSLSVSSFPSPFPVSVYHFSIPTRLFSCTYVPLSFSLSFEVLHSCVGLCPTVVFLSLEHLHQSVSRSVLVSLSLRHCKMSGHLCGCMFQSFFFFLSPRHSNFASRLSDCRTMFQSRFVRLILEQKTKPNRNSCPCSQCCRNTELAAPGMAGIPYADSVIGSCLALFFQAGKGGGAKWRGWGGGGGSIASLVL